MRLHIAWELDSEGVKPIAMDVFDEATVKEIPVLLERALARGGAREMIVVIPDDAVSKLFEVATVEGKVTP